MGIKHLKFELKTLPLSLSSIQHFLEVIDLNLMHALLLCGPPPHQIILLHYHADIAFESPDVPIPGIDLLGKLLNLELHVLHLHAMLQLQLLELVHVSLWAKFCQKLMHRIDELEPVLRLEALVLLFLDKVHQDIFEELRGGVSGSRR